MRFAIRIESILPLRRVSLCFKVESRKLSSVSLLSKWNVRLFKVESCIFELRTVINEMCVNLNIILLLS